MKSSKKKLSKKRRRSLKKRSQKGKGLIAHSKYFPKGSQVMINLGSDIPDFVSHFDRIVEIVGGNEPNKQSARQRFRQYKEANYQIHDHKIEKLTEND